MISITIDKDGEVARRQVWLSAWLAVATSDSCYSKDAPAAWADRCLEAFDSRFPPPEKEKETA